MITTGTIGQTTRLAIDPHGVISGAGAPVGWYVAAEDRWHDPRTDSGVRQIRVNGTPVTETRVRVPGGDVAQRICTVADAGGITVIEVTNDSTLPVAVAFDRPDLLTERPKPGTPIEGIDLPDGSFVVPIGHRSTIRVGLAHHVPAAGPLPAVPSSDDVVGGWLATSHRAGRIDVPSPHLVEAVVAERCDAALAVSPEPDPAKWLLALDQQYRMGLVDGADIEALVVDVAAAVAAVGPTEGWVSSAALDAAARLLIGADERRAVEDLARATSTRRPDDLPTALPDDAAGVERVAYLERLMVRGGELLPLGVPAGWHGQSFECHGLPTVGGSTVSYAVRWHAERPALLWEQIGDPIALSAPRMDPTWRTDAAAGEALWPPVDAA